ncbi:hypothetical protein DFA_09353 [Cavenderia fasciculata]|uniref:Uncharacterized protein n=1 Tax=Cavenderia fasciculata TaxID=261658 RepID=F4Q7E1_CACFS|nr:uncharacterized protein DFA_09353 [Cavenderia fasciculata]EGG16323.1 hypothetical protein DFA_09353 [Cavenderia fasciculata]|eukprot:XP_004354707.1 hypothetical protein DFA_09353 [Cavenderia fasciculata]
MSARFLSVFRNTVDLEFEHWGSFREAFLTVFASGSTDLAVMNRVLTQFRYDTKWTVSSFTNAFTIIAGRVYENNDNRSFVLAYKNEFYNIKTINKELQERTTDFVQMRSVAISLNSNNDFRLDCK